MIVLAGLPAWVVMILALLATAILVVLNVGGVRSARALLNALRREHRGGSGPADPSAD